MFRLNKAIECTESNVKLHKLLSECYTEKNELEKASHHRSIVTKYGSKLSQSFHSIDFNFIKVWNSVIAIPTNVRKDWNSRLTTTLAPLLNSKGMIFRPLMKTLTKVKQMLSGLTTTYSLHITSFDFKQLLIKQSF